MRPVRAPSPSPMSVRCLALCVLALAWGAMASTARAATPDELLELTAVDGVAQVLLDAAGGERTAWIACDSGDVDAVLLDAAGRSVQSDADGGPLGDARLLIPAGGPWTVEARVSGGSSARIVVRLEPGDVPLPDGDALVVLEALRRAEIAESMARRGDGAGATAQLAVAGLTLFNLGEHGRSTPVLTRATALAAEHGRGDLVPHLAILAAYGHADAGRLGESERLLALGAELLGDDGPAEMRVVALQARGRAAEQRGRLADAEDAYRAALELASPAWALGLLRQLADVCSRAGDPAGAVAALDEAARLADATGSADEQARVLLQRADVLLRQGDHAAMREVLARAEALAEDAVVRGRVASLHGSLASAEGQFVQARARFEQAIARFEAAGQDDLVGRALYNLALTALHHGRADEAAARIEAGLARDVSRHAERWLQALAANVAVERADDLRDRQGCVDALPPAAEAWLARARDDVEAARVDLTWAEDPILSVYLHLTDAEIHKDAGRQQDERAALARAREDAARTGPRWEAMVAVRDADRAVRQDAPGDALERAREAWAQTSAAGTWPEVLAARHMLVAALLRAGDGAGALAAVAETQRLVERPDFVLASDLDVMGFRGRPHYADLARLGQDAVALALPDAEGPARAEVLAAGVRMASQWKAYVLLGELVEAGEARLDPWEDVAAQVEPGQVLVEFAEGRARLYAYVHGDGPTRFHDLGPRCALERMAADYHGLVSDPLGRAGPAQIAEAGRALHERLLAVVPGGGAALVVVPSAGLSALPFEALVVDAPARPRSFDELTFVLDERPVVYAPSLPVYGALAARGARRAGERALVLADPRLDDAAWPALPGTRHEAAAILAAAGEAGTVLPDDGVVGDEVRVLLGAAATPAALRRELAGRAILHVGAHGVIDLEDPRGSALLLAPDGPDDDGRLTVTDVLALPMQAEVVVLAACDTGRGQVVRGEGVQSLARAFLAAGSRSVIVSLWPVRDGAAGATMARLYEELLGPEHGVAAAARAARLAVRRGEVELSAVRGGQGTRGRGLAGVAAAAQRGGVHPRDWAPFIVVGPLR